MTILYALPSSYSQIPGEVMSLVKNSRTRLAILCLDYQDSRCSKIEIIEVKNSRRHQQRTRLASLDLTSGGNQLNEMGDLSGLLNQLKIEDMQRGQFDHWQTFKKVCQLGRNSPNQRECSVKMIASYLILGSLVAITDISTLGSASVLMGTILSAAYKDLSLIQLPLGAGALLFDLLRNIFVGPLKKIIAKSKAQYHRRFIYPVFEEMIEVLSEVDPSQGLTQFKIRGKSYRKIRRAFEKIVIRDPDPVSREISGGCAQRFHVALWKFVDCGHGGMGRFERENCAYYRELPGKENELFYITEVWRSVSRNVAGKYPRNHGLIEYLDKDLTLGDFASFQSRRWYSGNYHFLTDKKILEFEVPEHIDLLTRELNILHGFYYSQLNYNFDYPNKMRGRSDRYMSKRLPWFRLSQYLAQKQKEFFNRYFEKSLGTSPYLDNMDRNKVGLNFGEMLLTLDYMDKNLISCTHVEDFRLTLEEFSEVMLKTFYQEKLYLSERLVRAK